MSATAATNPGTTSVTIDQFRGDITSFLKGLDFSAERFFSDYCRNSTLGGREASTLYRVNDFLSDSCKVLNAAQLGDVTALAAVLCSIGKNQSPTPLSIEYAFLYTAAKGHLVALRALLNCGPQIITDKKLHDAFLLASALGQDAIVQHLLSHKPELREQACNKEDREKALLGAVTHNSLYVVQLLLTDAVIESDSRGSPDSAGYRTTGQMLIRAAELGRIEIVKWLLNSKLGKLPTTLHAQALSKALDAKQTAVADLLLNDPRLSAERLGADDQCVEVAKIIHAAFESAAKCGSLINLRKLQDHFTIPEPVIGKAVQAALPYVYMDVIEHLLATASMSEADRGAALNRVAGYKHDTNSVLSPQRQQDLITIATRLLEHGPVTSEDRGAALQKAIANKHFFLIPMLLTLGSAGAPQTAPEGVTVPAAPLVSPDDIGRAAVSACVAGQRELVVALNTGNVVSGKYRTDALRAAVEYGYTEMFTLLPGASLGPDLKEILTTAAFYGYVPILQHLLQTETVSAALRGKAVVRAIQQQAVLQQKQAVLHQTTSGATLQRAPQSTPYDVVAFLLAPGPLQQLIMQLPFLKQHSGRMVRTSSHCC